MHSPVILLLHGFLIRRMLMSHCNGKPRGLFLFQFSAFLPSLLCSYLLRPRLMTADIWHTACLTILQTDNSHPCLQHVSLFLGPDWPWWVHVPSPPSSYPPSPSPTRRVPFIHPRSVGPWGSAATANLIKLTTIKIRLNYCKAVHWHPRSILKLKKRRPSDSMMSLLPAMGS